VQGVTLFVPDQPSEIGGRGRVKKPGTYVRLVPTLGLFDVYHTDDAFTEGDPFTRPLQIIPGAWPI
jgi:hypothetical protein